jgi:hypothetical protein
MTEYLRELDVNEFGRFMTLDDVSQQQRLEIYEAASDRIVAIDKQARFVQRNVFDFLMKTSDGKFVEFHVDRAYEAQEI